MADDEKKLNFYALCRQEYQKSNKPFTYELDLSSSKPKPRAAKFNILVNKFISIYKLGMKNMYDNQQDTCDNYWNELVRKFLGRTNRDTEMSQQSNMIDTFDEPNFELRFINDMYWQKPKNKLRKYFVLLLHSHKIFDTLQKIINQMQYLYENPKEKKEQFPKEISVVDFLKDGQFRLMGELVTSFDEYVEEKQETIKIRKRQMEIQKKKKQEQQRMMKIKQEQQRIQKERLQQKKKQDEQRRRKVQQQLLQKSKRQAEQAPIITSDYYPQQYRAVSRDPSKKNLTFKKQEKSLNIPNRNQLHNKHKKRSQILWEQQYQEQFHTFAYNLQPQLSQEDKICANPNCHKDLKSGIYFLGGNQNLCYYTGKWFCNDDISKNRMPIPWKAKKDFDLRGYTVCKTAYAQLLNYYEKPLIEIEYQNPVINSHKQLYKFLLLRRQIHLIYDSICNIDHIKAILKRKMNYCLKNNILSMKNLYDIYNGQQIVSLERDYQVLSRHFYRCDICQKKRGFICPKCKDPVRIFLFELKQTHGCKICRKLYHRKCLNMGKCDCNQD